MPWKLRLCTCHLFIIHLSFTVSLLIIRFPFTFNLQFIIYYCLVIIYICNVLWWYYLPICSFHHLFVKKTLSLTYYLLVMYLFVTTLLVVYVWSTYHFLGIYFSYSYHLLICLSLTSLSVSYHDPIIYSSSTSLCLIIYLFLTYHWQRSCPYHPRYSHSPLLAPS